MLKRTVFILLLLLGMLGANFASYAGTWEKDANGWFWVNDDGTYPQNTWQWLDGNRDGIAECYYFDASGYCITGTVTPDGYLVDENGSWILNGTVQEMRSEDSASRSYTDEELCDMAAVYYEAKFSHRPQFVDIEILDGNQVVLHLYDYVVDHTATCDWYTVDRQTGVGSNLLGEKIDLKSI